MSLLEILAAPDVTPTPIGLETWEERAGGVGVVTSTRFDTSTEITDQTTDWQGNPFADADHVSRDTTNVASGTGSMRMEILKTDGQSHGQWRWPFGTEFAEGETFYVQFRQYIPSYYATHAFSGTQFGGPYAAGWKQIIISNNRNSNQLFEVVLQNTRHRGLVQGYNRNTNGDYLGFDDPISTICSGSDIVYQNQIDRGPAVPTTCLEERQKRGGLFSYGSDTGAPDPETGAFIFYPDEWVTYYMKIEPGTFGQGVGVLDTRINIYAARDGDLNYTHLHDEFVNLGAKEGATNTAFDALWLLPYNTDGTADAGRQDTYTLYDEVIVSTSPIALPTAATGDISQTPLSLFVAGMSSNTWQQWTGMTIPAGSFWRPSNDYIASFANQGHWDPIGEKIIFIGQAHGTSYESRMFEYDAAGNSWSSVTPPIPDGSGANPSHGYYMTAMDQTTGDVYWHNYNDRVQKRRPYGSAWGNIANDDMESVQITPNIEFNPYFGSQGSLVVANEWGVSSWDKASNTSTRRLGGPVSYIAQYQGTSYYDEDSQSVYFAGGNGASTDHVKVDNAGSVSIVASLPAAAGVSFAGNDDGQMVSGWSGVKPALITSGGIYEYDPSGNSWSGSISTRPYSATENVHFLTAIPEYGCVVAMVTTSSSGDMACYVWKR